MRVGGETLTVPKHGGVLVGPEPLRQVFNDTGAEVLWLIVGAPEELEFLPGAKTPPDLSLIRRTRSNSRRNSPAWSGRRRRNRLGKNQAFNKKTASFLRQQRQHGYMTINPITDPHAVREEVRRAYGQIADGSQKGCCSSSNGAADRPSATAADKLGYNADEIAALPEGVDLGLGCGNPQAIASLQPGETVLDLGSGAGFDCFLAARSVGESGRVIGVDMTPEMLTKARANAARAGVAQVEFRLGEIEALPVEANSVDVIISNCVINLSPDKARVFREAFRVLKPGGRLAIADIMRTAELPAELAADLAAHCGCVAGAASIEELETMLRDAGFEEIRVRPKDLSREFIRSWIPGRNAADYVVSSTIEAVKPSGGACCAPTCCG
jgi:ubiquinone/menaquinone biosynthesis C-methylase UbiE